MSAFVAPELVKTATIVATSALVTKAIVDSAETMQNSGDREPRSRQKSSLPPETKKYSSIEESTPPVMDKADTHNFSESSLGSALRGTPTGDALDRAVHDHLHRAPPFNFQPTRSTSPPIRINDSRGFSVDLSKIPFPANLAVGAGMLLWSYATSRADSPPPVMARRRRESTPGEAAQAAEEAATAAEAAPSQEPPSEEDENTKKKEKGAIKLKKPGDEALPQGGRIVKKMLEDNGRTMYDKVKAKLGTDLSPSGKHKVWSNNNFRIDLTRSGKAGDATSWELQVNGGAESSVRGLVKGNTHIQLSKGKFDHKQPPSCEEWLQSVLDGAIEYLKTKGPK
ncbi:hypothetical protein BBAD15_g12255 [Beauveria bassiana D1-5]|uniref:Uncharacterized protein n=1 Tax=Beauveria bassiana D1-5 TaxID=1245745 RepID=A0A0A2V853_BEABA|nr:hypothetical protein BBAD15_g12255 [Beauveria bassiana D1-5]